MQDHNVHSSFNPESTAPPSYIQHPRHPSFRQRKSSTIISFSSSSSNSSINSDTSQPITTTETPTIAVTSATTTSALPQTITGDMLPPMPHPMPEHVLKESLDRRPSHSDASSLAEEGEATPLLGEDADGTIAAKWYTGPLFIAGLKFTALFLVFTAVVVGTFWFGLPKLEADDRALLKLPRSFADLQALNSLFQKYKTRYPMQILACGFVTYLFIQMFTLPGSMYLSILFGAAYGMVRGLFLACLCESLGSLLCYALSAICAPPLLEMPFYRSRVEAWRVKIMGDPSSGKQVTWDGIFAFLVVLRIAPFPPHWIANFVAPHLGIHPFLFWASCFVGIAPVSVIHVTIGISLDTMTSAADFHILSLRNVLGLCAVVVAVLIPVGLKRVFRKDIGDLGEADAVSVLASEGVDNASEVEVEVPVPAYPQISPRTYRAVDSGVVLAGPSGGDPNLDTDMDFARPAKGTDMGKGKGKATLLDVIVDDAAQVGISLKAPAPANRTFLAALLTKLESLRVSIGPCDAVDVEAASTAYVENFALRVFTSADNDDRAGHASLTTARKFLAAATFLELLKLFEDKTAYESHEDKIRYAKWKAADINRAIREGRKPIPGPAGGEPPSEQEQHPGSSSISPSLEIPLPPSGPPTAGIPSAKSPTPPPVNSQRDDIPRMPSSVAQAQNQRFEDIKRSAGTPGSPADWSTQATTGGADSRLDGRVELPGRSSGASSRTGTHSGSGQGSDGQEGRDEDGLEDLPSRVRFTSSTANGSHSSKIDRHSSSSGSSRKSGSSSSKSHRSSSISSGTTSSSKHSNKSSSSSSRRNRTTSLTAASAGQKPSSDAGADGQSKRHRHMSMVLESRPRDHSPPLASAPATTVTTPNPPPPPATSHKSTSAPASASTQEAPRVSSPTHFVPKNMNIPGAVNDNVSSPLSPNPTSSGGSPPRGGLSGMGAGAGGLSSSPPRSYVPAPGNVYSPSSVIPPPPPPQVDGHAPYSSYPSQPYASQPPQPPYPSQPSYPSQPTNFYASAPPPPPPPVPAKAPSPPPELTPLMIAKAQKHCRFAISALDYEDAEQAKKELRAALAVLGE